MKAMNVTPLRLTLVAAALVLSGLAGGPGLGQQPRGDPFRSQEIPEGLDLARQKLGETGQFVISIKPSARNVKIGRMHNWTVRVRTKDGSAVEGASIGFEGGMPSHHHGFPTVPRVTKYLGNGTYLVEGVRFNMTGWWEFVFEVSAGDTVDRARFNVVIED